MHFVPVQFVRLQLPPSCGKAWSTKHLIKCLTVFPFMWQPSSSAAIPYLFIASAYTGKVASCHAMPSPCIQAVQQVVYVYKEKSSRVYRIIIIFCVFSFLSVSDMECVAECLRITSAVQSCCLPQAWDYQQNGCEP